MKKIFLPALLLSLMATNAQASIAEKKAIRAADADVAAAAEKTQAACGNTELTVNHNWDQFRAMADNNAEIIADKDYKMEWIIGQSAERTVATLEALAKICNDDADYKEVIAELTTVEVTPKESFEDYQSAFTLEGTTLKAETGYYMSRSASDFVDRLKALY